MRWSFVLLGWTGCVGAPDWLAGCACGEGEICRAAYEDPEGDACVPVPEACGAVYGAGCSGDVTAVDDACLEAVCGAVVPGHEAACWNEDGVDSYWLSCTSSL